MERYGGKIKVIMGSYSNIKITTPDDLIFAEYLLSKKINFE
jgi:2-C-methyl-D-erythritol 4-phosphate cytidylyltransferase